MTVASTVTWYQDNLFWFWVFVIFLLQL